jgi:DNA helicase II / ATP-dependent DNA helicase PcrA
VETKKYDKDKKMNNDNVLQNILQSNFHILVKSSAGTGKTFTMIAKIKHEVEVNGVNPANIMVSTFTVDAANEIKNRLPASCSEITSGTLHSIMLDVVKKNGGCGFVVLDSAGQQKLGFDICKENKLNFDRMNKYFGMIGYLKSTEPDYYEMLENGTLPGMEKREFRTFVTEYYRKQKFTSKHGNDVFRLDFADMLLFALDIFRKKPEVLELYRKKWKYVFIDEAQDLSKVQAELLFTLCKKDVNVCAIGDNKQTIFGFSGASMEFINTFHEKYENVNIFELPITYRCSKTITEQSNHVANRIDGSKIDTISDIIGMSTARYDFETWSDEAEYVSEKAIELFRTTDKSIRIIFRTNAQALNLQLKLISENIPFSSNSSNNIFNRKEVKIGLALCSFLLEYDSLGMPQKADILKMMKFFIPDDTNYHNFIFDVKKCKIDPLQDESPYRKYEHFIDELEILKRSMAKWKTPSDILNGISGMKMFDDISDNAEDNLIGLSEFFRKALTMNDVRELIDIISKPREVSKNERCIVLSTVHGSKGLESQIVMVTGVSDGLFPLGDNTVADYDEEELRLFYVAVTRSKEDLYLTGCKSFGKRTFNTHSFINILFETIYK